MRLCLFSFLLAAIISAAPSSIASPENPDGINIGFDLHYGYGTASISFPHGTVLNIAKVESSDEYRTTFRKLSLWENTHNAPPYTTPQQRWSDYPRQLKRRARKAAGLPSSPEVAALSTLIHALKMATEKALGFDIHSASSSMPRIPAIYDEDMYDAFEYANLTYLQIISSTYHGTLLTYSTMATLSGHGLSICANITHPDSCPIDDLESLYYIVDYTRSSLFAYYTHARSAYYEYETVSFDLDLGSDARFNNPDEEYYWEAVRRVLLRPLLGHTSYPPTKVILVGEEECVIDTGFRRVVDGVLKEFFGEKMPVVVDANPEWVGARGVAEFVRRRPYRPEPVKPEGRMVGSFVGEGYEENRGRELDVGQMEL